jgi:hypothetical protein
MFSFDEVGPATAEEEIDSGYVLLLLDHYFHMKDCLVDQYHEEMLQGFSKIFILFMFSLTILVLHSIKFMWLNR